MHESHEDEHLDHDQEEKHPSKSKEFATNNYPAFDGARKCEVDGFLFKFSCEEPTPEKK